MRGKRILLGITGGIAAYKIAFLIRLLKKSGAEVKCIMTPASSDFISPVVVSTLSENPVGIEFWDKNDGTWNNHVEYGLWADLFIIAPLTANTLSKIANGSCDNLLLATYLSMRAKTLVAPAMDLDMYAHATTQRNLKQLENDGVHVIPAESGALASGLEGEGRMAEPEIILASIEYHLNRAFEAILDRRSVLITAGPTFEALDPVRFIGNHSSGKMGYRIADELSSMGAEVILISGPTQQKVRNRDIEMIQVSTADQMFKEVQKLWPMSDFGIFSAAVADYKPKEQEIKKIKKNKEELSIDLVRNPDILKWAGDHKSNQQTLVGFALETNDLLENGRKKLISKNLDFIVLNTLQDKGAGFGVDTNKISILDSHNNLEEFELKPKAEVAKDIVSYLKTYLEK
jgi:phosphopantothenoylcysteine decarboxylase/phosphopantothenate--cysteine ligase